MKRHRNHVLEDLSLLALRKALPATWVVHEFRTDYGIDVQIEVFSDDGTSTGLRVYGQLKATDKGVEDDTLVLDRRHFEYWSSHTDLVALFRYYAKSDSIRWCWMHEIEWRIRPTANSLDVSPHLHSWRHPQSSSSIIELAKLRNRALHTQLTAPITVSVKCEHRSLVESLDISKTLTDRLPIPLFEVLSEPTSHGHFEVTLDRKRLCVSHLGLGGYVVSIDAKYSIENIADLCLLLIFLIAVQHGRQSNLREVTQAVLNCMWSVEDGSLLPLAIAGIMETLGIDAAVSRILKSAPSLEDPSLWLSLTIAGTRVSLANGETSSWLAHMKSWADSPPADSMAAAAAYNYANYVANSATGRWDEAEEYYEIAGQRDRSYYDREYYWIELGAAQFESGRFDRAVVSYKTALHISPSPGTQWRLGDAMFHCGNYKSAAAEISNSVGSGERIGTYPLLLLDVCNELMSRWGIENQTVALIDDETQDRLMKLQCVKSEDELVSALQEFMNRCAIDPLLSFNSGHFSLVSAQPQVAAYRFLACALRQRSDAEAWALATASALSAGLDELFARISECAYFYTGEDFVRALISALNSPTGPLHGNRTFAEDLIELVRSTKSVKTGCFTVRLHDTDNG